MGCKYMRFLILSNFWEGQSEKSHATGACVQQIVPDGHILLGQDEIIHQSQMFTIAHAYGQDKLPNGKMGTSTPSIKVADPCPIGVSYALPCSIPGPAEVTLN